MRRVLAWAFLLMLITSPAWAVTYWVSGTLGSAGTCANSQGTSAPANYLRTIQAGINCLSVGDTLNIRAGTYPESNRTLNNLIGTSWSKPTTVQGAPGDTRPNWMGTGNLILGVNNTRYAIIKDIIFDGINGSNNLHNEGPPTKTVVPVPYMNQLVSLNYTNSTITGTAASFIRFQNNVFRNSAIQAAQLCEHCTDVEFLDNEWTRIGLVEVVGVSYSGAPRTTYDGNYFHDVNGCPINFWNQDHLGVVNDGVAKNNRFERYAYWWGETSQNGSDHDGQPSSARHVKGTYNTRFGCGIFVSRGARTKVYNNTFIDGVNAISLGYGATDCIVANNSIASSPIGAPGNPTSNVYGNISLDSGGGGTTNCAVRNNIVYQPGVTNPPPIYNNAGPTNVFSNNLCSSAVSGLCQTVGNPSYKNVAGKDLHVPVGSLPCGAGFSYAATYTTDMDGTPRTSPWDQGAFVCTPVTPPPNPAPGSIVATWTFDAGAGTTVPSTVGTHPGTFTPNAAYGPGAVGPFAGSFDGTRVVNVTNVTGLRSTGSKTLSAWMKMAAVPIDGCDVVSDGDSALLNVNPNGSLSGTLYDGISWPNVTGGTGLLDDRWHHVLWTWDGVNQRVFIDNANVATRATTGTISYTRGPNLVIGGHGAGGTNRTCTGLIDEVIPLDGYCTTECVDNFFRQRIPLQDMAARHINWYAANAEEGTCIGTPDQSLDHVVTTPLGVRWSVCNGGPGTVNEYFPPYCRILASAGTVLVDWTAAGDSFGPLGIRFLDDSKVSVGQQASILLPTDGFNGIPGRFFKNPMVTTAQRLTVAPGQCADVEMRVEFDPSLAGKRAECRPHREDGSPFPNYTVGGTP